LGLPFVISPAVNLPCGTGTHHPVKNKYIISTGTPTATSSTSPQHRQQASAPVALGCWWWLRTRCLGLELEVTYMSTAGTLTRKEEPGPAPWGIVTAICWPEGAITVSVCLKDVQKSE
jgi:hypothetical protein